ncbi:hypothetical protein E2562_037191 [Oryza meyeriana var. granulata]|uniref:Uncharacterized protein n=1 Tax=Oryza meyeriana var. granulata TaxID=110450 RepID=A0A6G1D9Y2_9ORYZ|nr:hypothetical protein E2562_037191 [Oryza meyeriana var. granulata]
MGATPSGAREGHSGVYPLGIMALDGGHGALRSQRHSEPAKDTAWNNPLRRPRPRRSIGAEFYRGLEPPSPGGGFGGLRSLDPPSKVRRGSVSRSLPRGSEGLGSSEPPLEVQRGLESQSCLGRLEGLGSSEPPSEPRSSSEVRSLPRGSEGFRNLEPSSKSRSLRCVIGALDV